MGPGFAREEIKAALFGTAGGLTGEAVTTVQDICVRLLGIDSGRVLGGAARQDVLRTLLADRRISARMPELKRLKRQGQFYRRLDQAIQAGRSAFAHPEEERVLCERLEARVGPSAVRDEVRLLALAYEAWLGAENVWDLPLLLRSAIDVLDATGWPSTLRKPERIYYFTAQFPESRERAFWETLAREVSVEEVGPIAPDGLPEPRGGVEWSWELWHTTDDACDALADRLSETEITGPSVLICDTGSVRRSMNRALAERGLPLADPRDPTQLRWEEALKWGMLPLEVVARDFERGRVIAWLRAYAFQDGQAAHVEWVREIHERGLRQGLRSYASGKLTRVHELLTELESELGGRKTCREAGEAHLRILRAHFPRAGGMDPRSSFEVPKFFESLWEQFARDCERLRLGERRAPALYWLERLATRASEMPAPVARLKAESGLRTYRLQQAPLSTSDEIYILGMPAEWLDGDAPGDYWFSSREREVLGAEFAVRGAAQVREERARALACWLDGAKKVTVLDSEFDETGRERESIAPVLAELARLSGTEAPAEAARLGAHARWAPSFGAIRPVPPQRIELPPLPRGPDGSVPVITATALEHASRCGVRALVSARWKLRDVDEPDSELWANVRGNILHHAVRLLLEARKEGGEISIDEALEHGWIAERPKGLLQGRRISDYARSRLRRVLVAFLEKEREYAEKSGAKPIELDDRDFVLELGDFSVKGTPDRIDETPDGIFVMDYKSGSGQPSGTDMLEKGYRLQLPFYALAASRELKKPALGVQFVELTNDAKRASGVFFERYNGKEPGKLTALTRRSKSLLAQDPAEVWTRFEDRIRDTGRAYVNGIYEARPKKEADCDRCDAYDICGKGRLTPEPAGVEDASE